MGGLWEDEPHPRAFSSAKHHRIKYYYDDNGPDDEAFVKGWTVPKDLFLDDLKLFVETMKEAGATVGYWAIQDGNAVFTRIGETDDYKCYGESSELRGTTVPDESTESFGLSLDGFLMLPGRQSLCSTRRVAHGKTLCIRSLSNLGPTTIVVYDVMNTSLPCALLVPARVHSPCID